MQKLLYIYASPYLSSSLLIPCTFPSLSQSFPSFFSDRVIDTMNQLTKCCSCFRQKTDGASTSTSHQLSDPTTDFKGQPRLPTFVVPKRYDIQLKPDLAACKFVGNVSIVVNIVADTRFIVLNAAQLYINSDSVSFSDPNSYKVKLNRIYIYIY